LAFVADRLLESRANDGPSDSEQRLAENLDDELKQEFYENLRRSANAQRLPLSRGAALTIILESAVILRAARRLQRLVRRRVIETCEIGLRAL
jgi:hypothetical protein